MSENTNTALRPKKRIWLRILLGFLAVLFGVMAVLYGYFFSKYTQVYDKAESALPEITVEQTYDEIVSVNEDYAAAMAAATANLAPKPVVEATSDILQDKDVYNVLLIGTDERSDYTDNARGDTCILLSLNTSGDAPVVSLVSLERGMGVPILRGEYAGEWDWLTHTFRYGGATLLLEEVSECFKIEVDHYVRVNFAAFEAGIDAIGGVDVTFDEAEKQYFIDGYKLETAVVGVNHLNGKHALNYARLREIDNDWRRIERQREVIISAIDRCRHLSPAQINSLVDTLLPMVKTNIPQTKIAEMLLLVPQLRYVSVQQATIPQEDTYGSMTGLGGRSMFAVDFEANTAFLKEFLYPQIK